MIKSLPNLLTGARLVLALGVLVALAWAAGTGDDELRLTLRTWAFAGFALAAVTDFFDGWLARLLNAQSTLGAILDPIADKTLVAVAIVGLVAAGTTSAALPGGLILVREFAVSALRETLAPRGITLPVTLLAKWKTTLQLAALGLMLFAPTWSEWGLPCGTALTATASAGALGLLWLAAAITVWTGIEYARAARRALRA